MKCQAKNCSRDVGDYIYCSIECSNYDIGDVLTNHCEPCYEAGHDECKHDFKMVSEPPPFDPSFTCSKCGVGYAIQPVESILNHHHNIRANTTAMLKALDVYWAMDPCNLEPDDNCPYCGKPNKDDWFHETCFEDSWIEFQNARKKVEG